MVLAFFVLMCRKKLLTHLVNNLRLGSSLPRNNFMDQNWLASGLGEHSKKFGTPYLFLQPLKLATSNLVNNVLLVHSRNFRPISCLLVGRRVL